jgi:flagellar motor switch protein FliN
MSIAEITPRDALIRLGASTAEAIAQTLETILPDGIERGEVSIVPEGASPFAGIAPGMIATSVHYVDGVTGANLFVMPPAGARALASAMGVPPDGPPTELSELELSAVGEAANQMLATAAGAISVVLGQEVEISPPETRVVDEPDTPPGHYGKTPHACTTSFTIAGEKCRLIQLIPSAFVVRMARAFDEQNVEQSSTGGSGRGDGPGTISLTDALHGVNLRVWAELGRTKLALGQALELPVGAVVDLDRAAEAPVDLFVNGLCFGHGHLLVTDDGEWAIKVESLSTPTIREATANRIDQYPLAARGLG